MARIGFGKSKDRDHSRQVAGNQGEDSLPRLSERSTIALALIILTEVSGQMAKRIECFQDAGEYSLDVRQTTDCRLLL